MASPYDPRMPGLDKRAVLVALRERVERDLAALTSSQEATQKGATHEEARPESDKDTRAIEPSYLARGLAKRVGELQSARSLLANLALPAFAPADPIALSALVTTKDEDEKTERFFLAPAGGGLRLGVRGGTVGLVTPEAPLGEALVGKRAGDDVELETPQGLRVLTVVAIE